MVAPPPEAAKHQDSERAHGLAIKFNGSTPGNVPTYQHHVSKDCVCLCMCLLGGNELVVLLCNV